MTQEIPSKNRVLAYLKIAMKLEEEAIKRYENQIAGIENPEVNMLLEGIKRNEMRHIRMLKENMKLFKE